MSSISSSLRQRSKHRSLPDIPGKLCFLCEAKAQYMTKYSNWKDPEKAFVIKHCAIQIPSDSNICKKDYLEAKKYSKTEEYIPKWKVACTQNTPTNKCAYRDCDITSKDEKLIKPSFESLDLIQKKEISCIHNAQILVCSKHYRTVHRQLHPVTHCASCGAKPKHGHFIRHSPDATKVSAYLSGTSEDKVIQPQDYLCYTCYKLHLSILTSLEAEPKNSNEQIWIFGELNTQ